MTGTADRDPHPDGKYVTTIHWRRHEQSPWEAERGEPGYQPDPTVHEHDTLDDAERDGQKFGCLRGTSRVEVHDPDGTLQALWDKASTETRQAPEPWWVDEETGEAKYDTIHMSQVWQNLGAESQERHRRASEEIAALIREEIAANRSIAPVRLAGILKRRRAEAATAESSATGDHGRGIEGP